MANPPFEDPLGENKAKAAGSDLFGESAYTIQDPGTQWQLGYDPTMRDADPYINQGGRDRRSYMYGRDPNAANAAVSKAWGTGDAGLQLGQYAINRGDEAYGVGQGMLAQNNAAAQGFNSRGFQQGDFGAQNATLGQLGGLEAVQGPSAAQAQLQGGTNLAMASQLALARSGRGFGGNAAAMGQAQGNMAGIQANQANQAAMLRAQEDAAWRQRQASNLGNVAGFQGQQGQANLNAALQGQAQNDAAYAQSIGAGQAGYFNGVNAGMGGYGMAMQGVNTSLAGQGLGNQIRGQEMQGGLAQEDNALRYTAAKNGWNLAQRQQDQQETAGWVSAGATTAGLLFSDIRGKKDITRSDEPALEFARAGSMVNPQQPDIGALDAAAAAPGYGYRYIDPSGPGAAPGGQYGPMAQDLAKTPAGSTAVVRDADGKLGIDPARLTTLNTSAISAQQRQLDEIQGMLRLYGAPQLSTRKVPY